MDHIKKEKSNINPHLRHTFFHYKHKQFIAMYYNYKFTKPLFLLLEDHLLPGCV
jgi:hypothetical protein